MAQENIGILITDEKILLSQVSLSEKNELTVKYCEQRSVAGDNPKDVMKAVVQELQLEGEPCVLCLNPEEYEVFLIPELEKDAKKKDSNPDKAKLRSTVAQLLEYTIEEASIDYIPLPKPLGDQSPMAYIVAARESLIQRKLDIVQESGLVPWAVDIPEMAMRNLYQRFRGADKNRLIVHLLPGQSKIVKVQSDTIEMMRNCDMNTAWIFQDEITPEMIASGLTSLVTTIAGEIERSVNYSETMLGQAHVDEIVIVSNSHAMDQVLTELKSRSPIVINAVSIEEHLKMASAANRAHLYRAAFSIGAALRERGKA
ncbi:MAG: hypothetical protein V4490_03335 [Pseudomonadota bacterium]